MHGCHVDNLVRVWFPAKFLLYPHPVDAVRCKPQSCRYVTRLTFSMSMYAYFIVHFEFDGLKKEKKYEHICMNILTKQATINNIKSLLII